MNQESKSRFQQLRENELTAKGTESFSPELYPGPGYARNLCFEWPDGKRIFLSYHYLVAAEYLPEGGMIRLNYTSHIIELKGIRLEKLYEELMDYLPRKIICLDKRYNTFSEAEEEATLIQEMNITNV